MSSYKTIGNINSNFIRIKYKYHYFNGNALRTGCICAVRCAVVVRDAMRGPLRTGCFCAVRCAVVVRDAMRGPLRTGCICAVRCAVVVRDAMRGPLRTGCICAVVVQDAMHRTYGKRWLRGRFIEILTPCF